RLLLSIAVFRACMEAFTPSALLRLYLAYLLELLFAMGAASLAMRIVDFVADHLSTRLDSRQRAVSSSVLPLGVRIVKIAIFCIAILFTLAAWGYNTNAILAGVGVGGLAVALAAQKTIENLFGSVAVISDRPVLVGDFCQFGGQVGTVEDIGLRSTRIRTLDRTVVTIPNSTFSTMTLENYSRRDRMWFHPTVHLRRGTTPDEIRTAMEAILKVLKAHPLVDPTAVPVRFTKMTTQSFDLDVFSYVLTPDFNEFLRVQSELLLSILESLSALGLVLAVPIQEMVVTGEQEEEARAFRQILAPAQAVRNSA
ncbi:MAG TPA: mechanosensitive ion channel family protein, partial [Bryobacteraceae bacterium]|nr:mechanosensitive ion channel family protein [Bryobacteraceae bacterium]